jgi:transcriptional regulator with XRE-family HTH domain
MRHQPFSDYLTQLRTSAGLSNRELGVKAEVPRTLIAGLQSGRRRVGEYQASKIGKALGLHNEDLDAFILLAVNTCTEKVLKEAQDYPSTFINLIAKQLRLAGILPHDVANFQVNGNDKEQVVKIYLESGRTAQISSTLQFA